MSRSIKHPYTKAKAVSKQCRNNGNCPYCRKNRTHKNDKHINTLKLEVVIALK